jgi:Thioredoxin domain-containing protein
MVKPTLERVARDYNGKVSLVSINVDESPELPGQFKVMGVPTVLTFQGEEAVNRLTGAKTETIYRTLFEALSEGKEVKIEMAPIDRLFRLVTGTLLVLFGLSSKPVVADCRRGGHCLPGHSRPLPGVESHHRTAAAAMITEYCCVINCLPFYIPDRVSISYMTR